LNQSQKSTNDKVSIDDGYLRFYFLHPSNQIDCLKEIAQQAWEVASTLEEFDTDYIHDWIEICSGKDSTNPADIIDDKSIVYSEVETHISEEVGGFNNGNHNFLEEFYQLKEIIIKLIEDSSVLNNVVQVISIFEMLLEKLNDTFDEFAAKLCYSWYAGHLEELEHDHGKQAIKYFKKHDELTIEDYEFAFGYITDFMRYVNERKFSFRLEELASRLNVFCKMKTVDSEKEEPKIRTDDQRPVALIQFMQKHCEKQKIQLLRYRRKSLNDANIRKCITLPEPIRIWKTGQAKYYKAIDLKEKWPSYCEILPNLPPLKQS